MTRESDRKELENTDSFSFGGEGMVATHRHNHHAKYHAGRTALTDATGGALDMCAVLEREHPG